VRLVPGLLLLCAAGCAGFDQPTPARLQGVRLDADDAARVPTRCRFQMSLDSRWLAGEFEGVVLADPRSRRLRAQLFGDLGPKMADLMADGDRIVGYFPQTREGIDCVLPREADYHLLLFLAASLVEEFLTSVDRSRVTGVREESDGVLLRLRPALPGVETQRLRRAEGKPELRRSSWMTGIWWEEEWPNSQECRITAPGLTLKVRILERTHPAAVELTALKLPDDVRIVAGSRK
jgi:hypothetical protein